MVNTGLTCDEYNVCQVPCRNRKTTPVSYITVAYIPFTHQYEVVILLEKFNNRLRPHGQQITLSRTIFPRYPKLQEVKTANCRK
jgi:hypothetical protein